MNNTPDTPLKMTVTEAREILRESRHMERWPGAFTGTKRPADLGHTETARTLDSDNFLAAAIKRNHIAFTSSYLKRTEAK